MHVSIFEFFIHEVKEEEFKDKEVLEIGSKYVNGSIRPFIEKFLSPKRYIGIDFETGKYVDIVLEAEKVVDYFGSDVFDVVISTEVLEHVEDWPAVVNNIKKVLKPGGYLYITTRSLGFPFHGYPYDFWRYELDDMEKIFSDFEIISLKADPEAPGVFLKARKPHDWNPADLSNIYLYSMILNERTKDIVTKMPLKERVKLYLKRS